MICRISDRNRSLDIYNSKGQKSWIIDKDIKKKYSHTCLKRSPFGQRKGGLIRQVTTCAGLTVFWILCQSNHEKITIPSFLLFFQWSMWHYLMKNRIIFTELDVWAELKGITVILILWNKIWCQYSTRPDFYLKTMVHKSLKWNKNLELLTQIMFIICRHAKLTVNKLLRFTIQDNHFIFPVHTGKSNNYNIYNLREILE